jgi:predicted nuclease with TOPRIM domain
MSSETVRLIITSAITMIGGGAGVALINWLSHRREGNAAAENISVKTILEIDERVSEKVARLETRMGHLEEKCAALEEKNSRLIEDNNTKNQEISSLKIENHALRNKIERLGG